MYIVVIRWMSALGKDSSHLVGFHTGEDLWSFFGRACQHLRVWLPVCVPALLVDSNQQRHILTHIEMTYNTWATKSAILGCAIQCFFVCSQNWAANTAVCFHAFPFPRRRPTCRRALPVPTALEPAAYFLCLWVYSFWAFHVNGIMKYVALVSGFIYVTFTRSIHTVLYRYAIPFYVWILSHRIDVPLLFINLVVDRPLDCFCLFALMNDPTVNFTYKCPVETCPHYSWLCLAVALLGHIVTPSWVTGGASRLLSKEASLSPSLHSFVSRCYDPTFASSCPGVCEVVSCGSDLPFLMTSGVEHVGMCLLVVCNIFIGYFYISFGVMFIQIGYSFEMELFVFYY